MGSIPERLRERIAADPYMALCARRGKECEGRVTWEHAMKIAGRKLQRGWAIIPMCVFHHLGKGLVKWVNQLIALNRATDAELAEFPKAGLRAMRDGLRNRYANLPHKDRIALRVRD